MAHESPIVTVKNGSRSESGTKWKFLIISYQKNKTPFLFWFDGNKTNENVSMHNNNDGIFMVFWMGILPAARGSSDFKVLSPNEFRMKRFIDIEVDRCCTKDLIRPKKSVTKKQQQGSLGWIHSKWLISWWPAFYDKILE